MLHVSLQTFNKAPQQDYLDESTALAPSPGSPWAAAATAQQLQFPAVKHSQAPSTAGEVTFPLHWGQTLHNCSTPPALHSGGTCSSSNEELELSCSPLHPWQVNPLHPFNCCLFKLKKQPWNKKKQCLMCLLNRR